MNKEINFFQYLKDKIGYIVIYFTAILLVILTMHLTLVIALKQVYFENIIYSLLISIILLGIFLVYDYKKNRDFYKKLSTLVNSDIDLDDLLYDVQGVTREQEIFQVILTKLYRNYKQEITRYEDIHNEYLEFINQWVHQMKTPVSVINLLVQEAVNNEGNEAFESIGEENDKLYHGLEMVLYNARLNKFNLDFVVENIHINELLREVINDNKKLIIKNRVYPKIKGKENIIVRSDRKSLYFVINQLLINGVKYSKDGEKRSIDFIIKEEKKENILVIEDNGIGIAKEDLGRVFRAFFTGKNGRKINESTGMGLYLSKKVCDELGHRIWVESEEGVGSKFYVAFNKEKSIFNM